MEDLLLKAEKLEVGYHKSLFKALDFEIYAGQGWALVGRNGSGKSTLIKTMVDLIQPIGGVLHKKDGLKIAYVPQRNLFSMELPRTSLELVEEGWDQGWSFLRPWDKTRTQKAHEALKIVDALSLASQSFSELSEGQKQRVLIARALVCDPQLLILDEPTSAMDPINEKAIFELLEKICYEQKKAILVASHHPQIVPALAGFAIYVDRPTSYSAAGPVNEICTGEAFERVYGTSYCPLHGGEKLVEAHHVHH